MDLDIFQTGSAEYGQFIKALICGDPGTGKTLTSSTFPNPFYASAEGGLMSVASRGLPATKITQTAQLVSLKQILEQTPEVRANLVGKAMGKPEPVPVDTVIIDTIDEVARMLVRERLVAMKRDAFQISDWGWLGEQLRSIIRGYRNLDMHVVFTCHVKETKDDETGRVFFKPAIQGSVGDEISGLVDLALLLVARPTVVVEDNKTKRVIQRSLQTFPDGSHPWIKDRSGKLPMELPINFDDDYSRIAKYIFGDLPVIAGDAQAVDAGDVNVGSLDASPEPVAEEPLVEAAEPALVETGGSGELEAPDANASSETESPTSEPVSDSVTPVEAEAPEDGAEAVEEPKLAAAADRSNVDAETGEVKTATSDGPPYTCSECGSQFDNGDVKDLSVIKFRRVLDQPCLKAAMAAKRK